MDLVDKNRERRGEETDNKHDNHSAIAKGQNHYVGTESRIKGEEKRNRNHYTIQLYYRDHMNIGINEIGGGVQKFHGSTSGYDVDFLPSKCGGMSPLLFVRGLGEQHSLQCCQSNSS